MPWTVLAPFRNQSPDESFHTSYSTLSQFSNNNNVPSYIRLHPLHLAVAISSHAVVRALISGGCCINALDSYHRNPLHVLIQSPPIKLPLQEDDTPSTWPARLTDRTTNQMADTQCDTRSNDLVVYEELSRFLSEEAGRTSSNEAKIASLLCNKGIDLNKCDIHGRRSVDYARDWLCINRLIRSGLVGTQCINPIVTVQPDHSTRDCPIPIQMPPTTVSSSSSLVEHIPHTIVDVILSYEDRLRLCAIAPIVGLNVGGHLSPRQLVRIDGRPVYNTNVLDNSNISSLPSSFLHTPNCCTPESKILATDILHTEGTGASSSTESAVVDMPSSVGVVSRCRLEPSRAQHDLVRQGSRRRARQPAASYPPITNSSPLPGVAQFNGKLVPPTQTILHSSSSSAKAAETSSQTTLAETCLSAFKRSVARRSTMGASAEDIPKSQSKSHSSQGRTPPLQDDLAVFLTLASSTRFRCHSALLTIWEFLGAKAFSPLPKSRNSTESNSSTESIPV